jgi:hypothetical protein
MKALANKNPSDLKITLHALLPLRLFFQFGSPVLWGIVVVSLVLMALLSKSIANAFSWVGGSLIVNAICLVVAGVLHGLLLPIVLGGIPSGGIIVSLGNVMVKETGSQFFFAAAVSGGVAMFFAFLSMVTTPHTPAVISPPPQKKEKKK